MVFVEQTLRWVALDLRQVTLPPSSLQSAGKRAQASVQVLTLCSGEAPCEEFWSERPRLLCWLWTIPGLWLGYWDHVEATRCRGHAAVAAQCTRSAMGAQGGPTMCSLLGFCWRVPHHVICIAVAGHAEHPVLSVGALLVCRACKHDVKESSSSAACVAPA